MCLGMRCYLARTKAILHTGDNFRTEEMLVIVSVMEKDRLNCNWLELFVDYGDPNKNAKTLLVAIRISSW